MMERLLMTYLRDLIHRLRLGQSQRQIARDLGLARETVHKYTLWAASPTIVQSESKSFWTGDKLHFTNR